MLGYGFSDKPEQNYSYSLMEQADTVLKDWEHFGIKGGHLLSNDMGNSVPTEILARHENGILPAQRFSSFQLGVRYKIQTKSIYNSIAGKKNAQNLANSHNVKYI